MIGFRTVRRGLTLSLILVLAACANAATVQQAPADAGVMRSFDATYDQVRAAALGGLTLLRLQPSTQSETTEGHMILVARPPHGFSWGEVGRILIERSSAPPTTVRVLYEKRLTVQFAGSQSAFARNLFAKMDEVLGTPGAGTKPTAARPASPP